jgi:biotin carboxyl carrier protein
VPEDRDTAHAKDHAGIDRLLDALVPALVAKLGTLNVGELEIRQDDWRVRLQRPPGAGPAYGRRASDRTGQRSHPGHDGLGSVAAVRASGAQPATTPTGASGNGTGPSLTAVGPGRAGETAGGHAPTDHSPVHGPIATSPAVGVFQPGPKAVGGTRVRAGDRLGVVDMLGIPQDVNAPADGIVVGVIVEAGTAVEYGQELIHIEAAGPVEAR